MVTSIRPRCLTDECPSFVEARTSSAPLISTLKQHQRVLLRRCVEAETGPLCWEATGERLDTQFAVMGDKVGSGKSFVIMALVFATDHTPTHVNDVYVFDRGTITLTVDTGAANYLPPAPPDRSSSVVVGEGLADSTPPLPPRSSYPSFPTHQAKTSLLVVPHVLFGQWREYLNTHASPHGARWYGVNSTQTLNRLQHPASFDLILVTSTFYCRLYDRLVRLRLRLRRVVVDEADSISIPAFRVVPSRFIWMVTASYDRIFDGSMTSLCQLRDRMARVAFRMSEPGLLVIKTDDAFADSSFMLPEVVRRVVSCKEPRLLRELNGRIDASIMNCLNANDVRGAFRLCDEVNTRVCESENALVSLMVSRPRKDLNRVRVRLSELRGELLEGGSDCGSREAVALRGVVEELEREERRLSGGIQDVRERIEGCDVCAICFDTVRHKTVVSCCSNGFCYGCVTTWMARSSSCPLCKRRVTPSDLSILAPAAVDAAPGTEEEDERRKRAVAVGSATHGGRDKMSNLRILVDDLLVRRLPREAGGGGGGGEYRKVIVFSEHDGTFREVSRVLKDAGIRSAVLQGTPARVEELLASYRDGSLDVILANARCYGSGLNLQCTTDIVIMHSLAPSVYGQVVGRAQRCGRATPLTTWVLLHPNEEAAIAGDGGVSSLA